jgi:hypothetical protein
VSREIRIVIDVPEGWDWDDFEYVVEKLSYVLARDLSKSAFTIEEIDA